MLIHFYIISDRKNSSWTTTSSCCVAFRPRPAPYSPRALGSFFQFPFSTRSSAISRCPRSPPSVSAVCRFRYLIVSHIIVSVNFLIQPCLQSSLVLILLSPYSIVSDSQQIQLFLNIYRNQLFFVLDPNASHITGASLEQQIADQFVELSLRHIFDVRMQCSHSLRAVFVYCLRPCCRAPQV